MRFQLMWRFLRQKGKSSAKDKVDLDRLTTSPCVKVSFEPDETMALLNLRSGQVFTANGIGARIWQGIAQRETLNGIAAAVSAEFQAPVDQVRQDTAAFVTDLLSHGFLELRRTQL